ncbi:DNA replication protein, partial [Thermoanaerobacterium sp. PSU-2]|uniref:ATP-binding protein n=1 Tax=Thermoanaerobacterium sp. PSU-2 TaxID=1930849 RepID=UPI000A15F4D7
YECPICKDMEWIIDDKTNTARPCKCREVKTYKRILENSGISEAFQKRTFKNFITTNKPQQVIDARNMAIRYVKEFDNLKNAKNNSIAFLGQVGSGKTHLSIAIANELMKKNVGVLYMQYREAIIQLKQCIMDEENYNHEIDKYKNATVLLIDDLYKGKITDSDRNIMFEIINYRYLKNSPIIVSSELTVDAIIDIDEAIGSRIVEMCKGHIFEFSGQELNYRLN